MPAHDIEIELPRKVVLHKDVTIVVKSGGAKLGELRLSKGGVDWVPAKYSSAYRVTWERLDAPPLRARQEGEGRPARRRRRHRDPLNRLHSESKAETTTDIIRGPHSRRRPPKRFYILAERLVAQAGNRVLWSGQNPYLPDLVKRGAFYPGPPVLKRRYARACHHNAAINYLDNNWSLVTGYALSEGGLWRIHSFNVDDKSRLIETTERRLAYYGITLEVQEADQFAEENVGNF